MRKFSRVYLVIAALAVIGCVLLLLDHAEYDAAQQFRMASECPDTSTGACYQLYPGVLESASFYQTTSGEQDKVTISSQGANIAISLLPTQGESKLLVPGTAVTVEWYVGSVSTVWIGGRGIPSTSNLAASHSNFAYIGWMVLWLAGLLWGILLLNRRMAVLIWKSISQRASDPGPPVLLPSGNVGWLVRTKAKEMVFLPLGLLLLVLLSIRPLLNPDMRWLALLSDALVLVPVGVRLWLELRNGRLMCDHNQLTLIDWSGHSHTCAIAEVREAALVGFRWTDWMIPAILFIGHDESVLLGVSGLFWDLSKVAALCEVIGIEVSIDYVPPPRKQGRWSRRLPAFALSAVSLTLLILSFLPLPPSNS